ncbi:MAG: tRNA (adenosine(37)-N6)-dimethylallyltransferase MiaA [Clostridiaceae bacterium]|jgi:tRNA dimethylallyltransferase|nr:tRNA (adenosine(37)-N6)-dimethylallyltransferase MiaA [Clostridiaceae bacterium]
MDKVMVIAGPTASGKTDLAVELALMVNGEIISADSMQIYRGMNIGTAKPAIEERRGIPHYLLDIVNPDETYSVAQFKDDALACINDIIKRGKTPIVAGGTGLYINSLVYNITFSETIADWEYREELKKMAEEQGPLVLHERLQKIDPKSAEAIHPNNTKRIIRALEVYKTTGIPISEHKDGSRRVPPSYEFLIYGLQVEREKLYQRIDQRVDKMMVKGLYDEVEELLKCGYSPKLPSLQGIGYKELISTIEGKCALSEAIDSIKTNTRRFAKRQITWFNKTEGLVWLEYSDANTWAILKLLADALNNEH